MCVCVCVCVCVCLNMIYNINMGRAQYRILKKGKKAIKSH